MTYTVIELRQAWRLIEGRYFREALVLRADGALRLFLIPDGRMGEMA